MRQDKEGAYSRTPGRRGSVTCWTGEQERTADFSSSSRRTPSARKLWKKTTIGN